jgi:hypothetical protein
MANEIQPAVEFQSLPLEMLIAAPLTAAVKAQRAAAEATLDYIRGQLQGPEGQPKTPMMIELAAEVQPTLPANAGPDAPMPPARAVRIRAPLLAMLPVPALQVDLVSVNFKYEVGQVVSDKKATSGSLALDASAKIGPWVQATLKGSLSSNASAENTVHRGGTLDITVRASQAPVPAGLSNFLAILSRGVLE